MTMTRFVPPLEAPRMKHVLAGGLKDLAFGEGSVTDGARHRRGALFQ